MQFYEVWSNILKNQGEVFRQIRGRKFTYEIRGDCLIPNTTNVNIGKKDFEKAYMMYPLKNTMGLQDLRGPSYIFAVLMDKRIVE